MLKLLNAQRQVMPPVTIYKDLKIERVLDYDDRTLSFSIPIPVMPEEMKLENYIQTKSDEYVIKQININNGNYDITAQLNIDELEGTHFDTFKTTEQTVEQCVNLALAGTGWLCKCDLAKKRTIKKTNASAWEVVKQVVKTYRVEPIIDSLNKIITFVEKRGSDRGVYFSSQLNLKSVTTQAQTADFYTRIIPVGKDGLTIESVNDGKKYLEDYTYSPKVKTYYWKDERYTVAENLKADAELKLYDLAHPVTAYTCDMLDLAKINKKYSVLQYSLGDIVTIIDKITKIREQQRIVKLTEYPDNPENNTCELSNVKLSFEQYAQKYEDTSSTVDNITTDNGTIDGDCIDNIPASKVLNLDEVIANSAKFVEVSAQILNVSDRLNAANAKIGTLETTMLTATQADLKYATIENLTAVTGRIETLETNALTAGSALIHSLTSDVANINTLMFGTASGGSLTTEFSNTVVGLIGDAQIKSAMIKDITADKIVSGKLYTNIVEVCSQSGNLDIADNTLMIKDDAKVTRVQLGKDASGDYNMYIWDKAGNIMFDALGLTESGIKREIIRNDMIAENANISAKKLDINSLFTEINGSTETIKANRIYVDADNQTLDVAFKTMSTSVTTATTTANTALSSAVSAENAINGLQIGGRNLLRNSSLTNLQSYTIQIGNWYLLKGHSINYDLFTEDGIHGVPTTTDYAGFGEFVFRICENEENSEYTLSCDVKSDCDGYTLFRPTLDNNTYDAWWQNGFSLNTKRVEVFKDKWVRANYTFSTTDLKNISMRLYVWYPSQGVNLSGLTVKNIKLEKGNKATDYSIAPEDTDSSISAVDARVTTLTETVSTQGTQLTAVQGQLSSKIWQQDITTAVNELQIGGRNLAEKTNQGVTGWFWGLYECGYAKEEIIEDNIKCCKFVRDEVAATGWSYIYYLNIGISKYLPNKKYTVTFEVKASVVTSFGIALRRHNGSGLITDIIRTEATVLNTWTKLSVTLTTVAEFTSVGDQILYINGMDLSPGVTYIFRNLKIEEGTKASSWSPAPEDVDSSIAALEGTTTTLSNQYTSLNQSLTSLTATVSSNTTAISQKADGSTVTALKNNLTELQADLTEYKTTVSESYTTKAEFSGLQIGGRNLAESKNIVNFYNDSKLFNKENYTTDGEISQIITKEGGGFRYDSQSDYEPNSEYVLRYYLTIISGTLTKFGGFHNGKNVSFCGFYIDGIKKSSGGYVFDEILNDGNKHFLELHYITPSVIPDDTGVNYSYIQIGRSHTEFPIEYKIQKFKLEKGNKATDYSPAPEDVDSSIAEVNDKFGNYSTTTQMNSAIEQKAGSILQTVSGTYATQDSLGNYATTQSVTASLALKIDKTDNNQIISMINASADVIRLTANRFILDSTYSKINQDGTVYFTGGKIGGFTIDDKSLFNVQDGVGCGMQKFGQGSAFWAGPGGVGNGGENAEFKVRHDGSVFAQKMYITGGSLNINNNFIIDTSGNIISKGAADFQCATVYSNDFHSRGSMYIENSLDVGGTIGCDTLLVKDCMYVSDIFYYWYNGAWVTLRDYISAIVNGG